VCDEAQVLCGETGEGRIPIMQISQTFKLPLTLTIIMNITMNIIIADSCSPQVCIPHHHVHILQIQMCTCQLINNTEVGRILLGCDAMQ